MFLLGDDGRLKPGDVLAGMPFTLVTSASDLKAASECEWGFLRRLDGRLGRAEVVEEPEDPMNRRAAGLGDRHEQRQLERYREEHPGRVAEVGRPADYTRAGLQAVAQETREAFASDAQVVFQATFFEEPRAGFRAASRGRDVLSDASEPAASHRAQPAVFPGIAFLGFADFIVRMPGGHYRVQDTKLARRARVTALLQLAAYAEQLRNLGLPVDDETELLLGDGTVSRHRLADIEPVFHNRRARLHAVLAEHLAETDAVGWGDERYALCGRCEHCGPAVEQHRDVLLVAGLRLTQRERLREAGIHTIGELAASTGTAEDNSVDRIAASTFEGLREQAALQLAALAVKDAWSVAHPNADVAEPPPPYVVSDPVALGVLPPPDAGDIFFDFEGDPLYTEAGQVPGQPTRWGVDYLFGLVDRDEVFTAFWAHDWREERQALLDFLDFVKLRRAAHPGMHIYHYASYERTHLTSLAARYGVGEDDIDDLLREGVLVDLYPLVRKAVRVGSRSYSIKKLEPLYMGDEHRDSDGVTTAGDSIIEYVNACELRDNGDLAGWRAKLDEIADYNKYDCVSTLRLRDWLLGHAADHGVPIGQESPVPRLQHDKPSPLREALLALASDAGAIAGSDSGHSTVEPRGAPRSADQLALALAAAAIDYHSREGKIFWWGHFARLIAERWEWENTRDVFVVEGGEVLEDWTTGPRGGVSRRLRLWGRLAPGSSLDAGSQPFAVYQHPGPFRRPEAEAGARPYTSSTIVEIDDAGCLIVRESRYAGADDYRELPEALTPPAPPSAGSLERAIHEWGGSLLERHPEWPVQAAVDVLRRTPPRLRTLDLEAVVDAADPDDRSAAVMRAVLDLDDSYLAVQGPPGTGKTYVGAHVIAGLVRDHGWKVGVAGQSHKVVENLLTAVVGAGLDPARVGKSPKQGESLADAPFTVIPAGRYPDFTGEHEHEGYVIGGTAWAFARAATVPRRELDLLVIDEAGQFSLAATIAASVAARNLLLLGDPQQLPQVSQAVHPEPIQTSALGWVSDGHDVLPPRYGFFLAESRRMHPGVTAPVSHLSYEDRLRSHECAAERQLDGVTPGVHLVPVRHTGNNVESPEEALEVVRLVDSVLGAPWTDPDPRRPRHRDPLTAADLIVVTPYNAQLSCVREALDAAGHPDVRVGTVDKFQGQEAVVAIVSLAASTAHDVPRGMEFLIMKNRLNVALSRAQWAAYLVYSPALADYLPITPEGVARLSAFIDLVEPHGGMGDSLGS